MRIIFIFAICLAFSFNAFTQGTQGVFEGRVVKSGNQLIIEVRNITSTSSLPITGDEISDLTLSLIFPTSANVTFGSITNGLANIVKSGGVTSLGSDSYQQFSLNAITTIPSDWTTNTYYEMFRVAFTAGSAMSGDEAGIAAYGVVSNFEPVIDFNAENIYYDIPNIEAAPLPITIKTFSATKDGERSSRLDWTSSSEINSDFIAIERSTDGEDWTTVGHVKAAGNSNRDIDYIYYDRSLPMARSIDNIFYYRLRLTDLDGQYKYSETRGVNMGRLEGLVSIYPNPATDIINVDLTDMDLHEGIIHLSVYDNTGKAIISKEVNGAGIEPIQASNMAAGSYQVVVKQGDITHRKQIIVVN